MANFTIGPLTICVAPAAIMKCAIGLNAWQFRRAYRGQPAVEAFCAHVCEYIMRRPDEIGLELLQADVSAQIARLQRAYTPRPPGVDEFSRLVRTILRSDAQRSAIVRSAERFTAWFEQFCASPYLRLAQRALERLALAGITLTRDGRFRNAYAALTPPRQLSTGQYVPWLAAVAVQMDTICDGPAPAIEFIETLLHEQIHAIIHERMRDNGEHYHRLPWFNELSAIALSQYAVAAAAADLRPALGFHELRGALRTSRAQQRWGDLAGVVMLETGDPLVFWRAWQAIFARGSHTRRNYAHRAVLPPILQAAGWAVSFPYHYGDQSVDCRDERVP